MVAEVSSAGDQEFRPVVEMSEGERKFALMEVGNGSGKAALPVGHNAPPLDVPPGLGNGTCGAWGRAKIDNGTCMAVAVGGG